jgi:cytochrome c-type biogenesis protein CcmE
MKKTHIFVLLIIAAAVGVIISTMSGASSYVTFAEARLQAAAGNPNKVHVVGTLPRDASKQPLGLEYDARRDPNYFAFTLVDTLNVAQRVVYHNPAPPDLVADQILTKCPSKYVEKDLGKTAPPATAMNN